MKLPIRRKRGVREDSWSEGMDSVGVTKKDARGRMRWRQRIKYGNL